MIRQILFATSLCACFTVSAVAQTRVAIETSEGTIVVELDEKNAPITCKNFLGYVNEGFYDGTVFHRVIKGFMIQGGGRGSDMLKKKTKPPITNEDGNGLKNDPLTLAMARTGDPDSATSQFFINTAKNDFLNKGFEDPSTGQKTDRGYAVFAKVVEGKDVVAKIESTKVKTIKTPEFPSAPMRDVPANNISIVSAKVLAPTP